MYHGCTSFPLTGSSQIPFVPILSLSTHDVGGGRTEGATGPVYYWSFCISKAIIFSGFMILTRIHVGYHGVSTCSVHCSCPSTIYHAQTEQHPETLGHRVASWISSISLRIKSTKVCGNVQSEYLNSNRFDVNSETTLPNSR